MSDTNETRKRQLQEAKTAIAQALTAAGEPSTPWDTVRILRERAKRLFGLPLGGEDSTEYFNRVSKYRPKVSSGSGKKATARVPVAFRPLTIKPHFRQAEIDAHPSAVSMSWDGRGVFWRQGSADFVGKGE